MKTPRQPPRPARTRAEYRWTGPKAAAFLRALADSGSVTKAAREVGMSRQSAHNLRGRLSKEHGPAFGRLWDEAIAIAISRQVAISLARIRAERARRGVPPRGGGTAR